MKLAQIQRELSFSKACEKNCKPCKPKQKRKPTYGQLAVENALLKIALRDASRIIAQDIYVRNHK